jgi:hypothetical protein
MRSDPASRLESAACIGSPSVGAPFELTNSLRAKFSSGIAEELLKVRRAESLPCPPFLGPDDVIARIDDRDYRVAFEQAEAQVAAAHASIEHIDAQRDVQQAQIGVNQACLSRRYRPLHRRAFVRRRGGLSRTGPIRPSSLCWRYRELRLLEAARAKRRHRLGPTQEKRLQFALTLHVNAAAWLQRDGTDEVARNILGHMDSVRQRIGLEPAGDIYGIAPHVVDEAVRADDAGNHGTGMYADPDLHGPAEVTVDPV